MGSATEVRIWLSASLPAEVSDEEKAQIRCFISEFSKAAFQEGWKIVHGSHPDVVPILLESAVKAGSSPGTPMGPVFVRSEYFPADEAEIHQWNNNSAEPVIRTPRVAESPDAVALAKSLDEMRRTLVAQSNFMVAVGGRWWDQTPVLAGVADEIELAYEKQLPLFLLAGFGGATHGFLSRNGPRQDAVQEWSSK